MVASRLNDSGEVSATTHGRGLHFWGMAIPLALSLGKGIYDAVKGNKKDKKAEQTQQTALDLASQQYNDRAPLRSLGMHGLVNNEQAIDMGGLSYDPNNPFAKARGPIGSSASLGNWDKTMSMGGGSPPPSRVADPRDPNMPGGSAVPPMAPPIGESGMPPDAAMGRSAGDGLASMQAQPLMNMKRRGRFQ